MNILGLLIPVSLFLACLGLIAFIWALKRQQFEDPKGDASRILLSDFDDHPSPAPLKLASQEDRNDIHKQ